VAVVVVNRGLKEAEVAVVGERKEEFSHGCRLVHWRLAPYWLGRTLTVQQRLQRVETNIVSIVPLRQRGGSSATGLLLKLA